MSRCIFCIISSLFLIPISSYSDTGWYSAYNGSPYYEGENVDSYLRIEGDHIEHPTIRMADENVDIYLHNAEATVFTEFTFENEGDETNVGMFFPLSYFKSEEVADFEVFEKDKTGRLIPIPYEVIEEPDKESGESFMTVAKWDTYFASNETKNIVCNYTAIYGFFYEETFGGGRWQMTEYDIWRDIDVYHDTYYVPYPHFIKYILSTGASWKGSIGKGRIAFHTTEEVFWEDLIRSDGKMHTDLQGLKEYDNVNVKIEGDALIIEFADIEPSGEENPLTEIEYEGLGFVSDNISLGEIHSSSNLPEDEFHSYNFIGGHVSEAFNFGLWAEGASGDGIGEWVRLTLEPSKSQKAHGLPIVIKGLHLYGGYHSDIKDMAKGLFEKNGAPSAVTIDLMKDCSIVFTKSFNLVEINDKSPDSQNIGNTYLDFGGKIECDEIKITIDDVRPGSKYQDTCISAVVPIVYDPRTHHSASSVLIEDYGDICRYHPVKIDDEDPNTCWVEGSPGDGIGEWVEFSFDDPKKLEGFNILSGLARDEKLWEENGRPERIDVVLYNSEGEIYREDFLIENSMNEQDFKFKKGMIDNVDKVIVTLREVYSGSKYNDTCISELEFY